jgi:hypothetical protein
VPEVFDAGPVLSRWKIQLQKDTVSLSNLVSDSADNFEGSDSVIVYEGCVLVASRFEG